MEDEPIGGFPDQVFNHLTGQDHAPGRLHFHLDRDVLSPVSLKAQLHPPAEDRPVHHPGQEIPDGPEKGDDFDLPDRTTHNQQERKFETRSTKSETVFNDKNLMGHR